MNIKYRKKLSIFIQFITIFTPSSPFNSPRGVVFSPLYRLPFSFMLPVHTFLSWVYGNTHTHKSETTSYFIYRRFSMKNRQLREKGGATKRLYQLFHVGPQQLLRWAAASTRHGPRWNFYVTTSFHTSNFTFCYTLIAPILL